MPIKPLEHLPKKPSEEKWEITGLKFKIGFLLILVAGGFLLTKILPQQTPAIPKPANVLGVNEINDKIKLPSQEQVSQLVKKQADNIIGEAVGLATDFASQSAATVGDIIFDGTVVNLIRQIDKLSPNQQDQIKKAVCR